MAKPRECKRFTATDNRLRVFDPYTETTLSRPVVFKLSSIEPLGFNGTMLGIRRRSSETRRPNPFLLSATLGESGVRQKLGKLCKGSVCL